MKKVYKINKFCHRCGEQMVANIVGAEEVKNYGFYTAYNPHSAYDSETGKRQYAIKYVCPKANWMNCGHSSFYSEEMGTDPNKITK